MTKSRWTMAAVLVALIASGLPAGAATVEPEAMPARILAAHNRVRADAGARPLVWDRELGDAAANYAVYLALTNSFQHSDQGRRPDTGENLWTGTRGAFNYEAMVEGWSSERSDFVPGVFPAVSRDGAWEKVGHYTQMVWPTTTRVGCAIASNASRDFLVCRYFPAGNIIGKPLFSNASYKTRDSSTYLRHSTGCRYRLARGNLPAPPSLMTRNGGFLRCKPCPSSRLRPRWR